MNRVSLYGRVSKKRPWLGNTMDGVPYGGFFIWVPIQYHQLAREKNRKKRTGEIFFCETSDRIAEIAHRYLRRNSWVLIEGSLTRTRFSQTTHTVIHVLRLTLTRETVPDREQRDADIDFLSSLGESLGPDIDLVDKEVRRTSEREYNAQVVIDENEVNTSCEPLGF